MYPLSVVSGWRSVYAHLKICCLKNTLQLEQWTLSLSLIVRALCLLPLIPHPTLGPCPLEWVWHLLFTHMSLSVCCISMYSIILHVYKSHIKPDLHLFLGSACVFIFGLAGLFCRGLDSNYRPFASFGVSVSYCWPWFFPFHKALTYERCSWLRLQYESAAWILPMGQTILYGCITIEFSVFLETHWLQLYHLSKLLLIFAIVSNNHSYFCLLLHMFHSFNALR